MDWASIEVRQVLLSGCHIRLRRTVEIRSTSIILLEIYEEGFSVKKMLCCENGDALILRQDIVKSVQPGKKAAEGTHKS